MKPTLETKIIEAATRYYTGMNLTMSDKEFDLALEQLRKSNPNHWVLKSIGWGFIPSSDNKKLPHHGNHPVGSLSKVKYPEQGSAYQEACYGATKMISAKEVEPTCFTLPKLDGLSVVCYFSGSEVSAVTRGNGLEGIKVTDKLLAIFENSSPEVLAAVMRKPRDLLAIRGEVIIPLEFEEDIKALGYANTRNAAAGIMNRKEDWEDLIKYLRFIPYFIRIDTLKTYKNQCEMIEEIWNLGFTKVECSRMTIPAPHTLKKAYELWKEKFPIDGLVIMPTYKDWKVESDYSEFETKALAYKFEDEEKEVVITNISWNVGSQGNICPVVEFDPVELSGAMVTRATAHNLTNLISMCLGVGAKIKVIRSNEVIPYITETVIGADKVNYPTSCPECGNKTQHTGAHLTCDNTNCGPRAVNSIYRLIEISGHPDGIAETSIGKWLDFVGAHTLIDLLQVFREAAFVESPIMVIEFGSHLGELLMRVESNIEEKLKKGFTLSEFWYIQNLPGVATSMSKRLSMLEPTTMSEENISEVLTPLKLPVNVVKSLVKYRDNWSQILEMVSFCQEEAKEVETSLTVCITGKLSMPRPKLVKLLEEKGVKVAGGVTNKIDYLICDAGSSSSGKYKKAFELGISIITEQELMGKFE